MKDKVNLCAGNHYVNFYFEILITRYSVMKKKYIATSPYSNMYTLLYDL
jgi:hypothetical protein